MLHRNLIDKHITTWVDELPKGGLYAPMAYLMGLPAKRVRPALVLMACELFGGRADDALDEALGIELFHNFTLMHDDIMDAAPLRRGQPTVHEKWNVNTAILSGDAMLVKAYQLMGKRPEVSALFSSYALNVCEGQQLDMDFEQRDDVNATEYMAMIRLKTAVLLACSLRVGAAIAGASQEDSDRIGAFGEHIGLAFQLRDDLLDAFGDPAKTGKQQGGDLRAGKKTFLLIRGLERERQEGNTTLLDELRKEKGDRNVERMSTTIEALGVRDEMQATIFDHHQNAINIMKLIAVSEERKKGLSALATSWMDRAF